MNSIFPYLQQNWDNIFALVMGILSVAEVIVRLTPSEKDNSILNKVFTWVDKFFSIFAPNKGTEGTVYKLGVTEHDPTV